MTQRRGYATMTFDMPHMAHFRIIKAFKQHCDFLMIGLTTDECAEQQKRKPIMSFFQRRAILENCKYVDLVVEHNGQTKPAAYAKLKFDVLLSSDEYEHSAEFQLFREVCPQIPVIFIPKVSNELGSTSIIASNVVQRLQETTEILCVGISGPITRQGFGPFFVTKPIHFSLEEAQQPDSTADVFGFFRRFNGILPRNWKSPETEAKGESFKFPMIPGINLNRELILNRRFRTRPWCTYITEATVFTKASLHEEKAITSEKEYDDISAFANDVFRSRQFCAKIVNMIQRDGGITLQKWCDTVCKSSSMMFQKCAEVEAVLEEIRGENVCHGDCHSRNLAVDLKTGQISLLDFGWSMGRMFQMCPIEQHLLEKQLAENWDLQHWRKSMLVCPSMSRWMKSENAVTYVDTSPVHMTFSADRTSDQEPELDED